MTLNLSIHQCSNFLIQINTLRASKRRSDTNEEDDLYIIGKWINSIPGKGMAKRETKGHIINNNKPFFSASFACEIETELPVTMTTMDDILFVLYSGQVPHNG